METVYEVALEHDLKKRGFDVKRQVPVRVEYDGIKFEEGFRADLIVGDCVICELKSIESARARSQEAAFDVSAVDRIEVRFIDQFRRAVDQGRHRPSG